MIDGETLNRLGISVNAPEDDGTYVEGCGCSCDEGCDVAPIDWETGLPRHHPSSERFHQLLAELGQLHDEKQKGYGKPGDPFANVRASSEWGMPAWVGALIRGQDKIRRLQSYAANGSLPFEAVEDAFRDLAVYAIIGLCLFEEEQGVE